MDPIVNGLVAAFNGLSVTQQRAFKDSLEQNAAAGLELSQDGRDVLVFGIYLRNRNYRAGTEFTNEADAAFGRLEARLLGFGI